jgi:hypothetical protein
VYNLRISDSCNNYFDRSKKGEDYPMESNERDEAIDNIQDQVEAGYEPDEIGTVNQQIEAD